MGFLDVHYCPNPECEEKVVRNAEKCPKCGATIKKMGSNEAVEMGKLKEMTKKLRDGSKELLVTDKMTDEEIKQKIYGDMMNLAMHESGTGWMKLGTLLSGNSTDQMLGAGFKALIDQNKILIRQNELILRALKK
ncbi:hypothetical protein MUO79_00835 [Candidatus Bathyarchaeota archaeon]|nr:hypothetical protein [Candidatus Bathyarchaeota archaeon]